MGKGIKRNRFTAHKVAIREDLSEDVIVKPRTKKPEVHGDWMTHGVMVSDHAVVRWLEIVGGFDVKSVREAIISDGRASIIKSHKFCKLPIGSRAKVVVRNGVVVTVIKPKGEYRK